MLNALPDNIEIDVLYMNVIHLMIFKNVRLCV